MFLIINKKLINTFFIVILISTLFCLFTVNIIEPVYSYAPNSFTVAIDAGHGGKDRGCTGASTGVSESDLNLTFSKKLEGYFKNAGIKVVQTRRTKDALYVGPRGFIKKKDMEARRKKIQLAKPDMVISIHMNEFSAQPSQVGAQTFYNPNNENSKKLSDLIQTQLNKAMPKQKINVPGDFYILKCVEAPSVIVECGFLSNAGEEALLQTPEYQEKLTYLIFVGAMHYFNLNK